MDDRARGDRRGASSGTGRAAFGGLHGKGGHILDDEPALPWVGRSGLGDIDLSEDGRELYAGNAADGRGSRSRGR